MRPYINKILAILLWTCLLVSCRTDDPIIYAEDQDTGARIETVSEIVGMYVLNEGNMGSNKCTLDYLDLSSEQETAHYLRNIYSERNPNVIKELGDVGNDIAIYGSRLWMVINCSDKVEVARAEDAMRIGQVNIPNCRSLAFDGGYAYVSAYCGPVMIDEDAQIGRVYKVDTLTLQKVDSITVGYQPEELAVIGRKLYVANSGGYRVPYYDRTVSEINLDSFREERQIDVALNLHRCKADAHGQLWVTSRGNYMDEPSKLCWLSVDRDGRMQKAGELPLSVSHMSIVGDSLYFVGTEWNYNDMRNSVTYGIVNVRTHEIVTRSLSDSPELKAITIPYGIIVNPKDRDFYLMDAKNYVSSGNLLHFGADGTFDWKVKTGDIPGHACFYIKERKDSNK